MITNPVGIDRPIQVIQQMLIANLWTDFNCSFNHRIFRNERNGKIIPEVFIDSSNDYKEVKFDDRYDVLSWFDVSDRTSSIDGTQINQEVGIFFAVNIKKLYPAIAHRAVEEVHRDVLAQIRKRPMICEVIGLSTGKAAYGDLDTDGLVKYNMQPWHTFRYNCNIKYTFNC